VSTKRSGPGGRPRALTVNQRITVAQRRAELLNAHAVFVRDHKRDRAVARLQAKWRRTSDPDKRARISAAIAGIGSATRVPIKPPEIALAEVNRRVARELGVSVRTVERCCADPRNKPFVARPVWQEPAWQRGERLRFEAQQLANRSEGATHGRINKAASIDRERLKHAQVSVFRLWGDRGSEVIPGPAPKPRVGCGEFYSSSFKIGVVYRYPGRGDLVCEGLKTRRLVRISLHCWVSAVAARRLDLLVVSKETVIIPGSAEWRHCGPYGVVVIRGEPDPAAAKRALKHWRAEQSRRWGEEPARELEFAERSEPKQQLEWWPTWKRIISAADPWKTAPAPWFVSGKCFVLPPPIRPPTITPRRWRTPWVRRLKVDVTRCGTFATTRDDSYVLGPHQTWKWILAKKGIHERAVLSRDHELYEFLRNVRQARIERPRLRSAHLTLAQRKYYAGVKYRPMGVWSTPRFEEISPAELRSSRSVGALLL